MSQANYKKQASTAAVTTPAGYVGWFYSTTLNAWAYIDEAGTVLPFSTTPADGSVTNAKLANVATQTFKGRTTAAAGSPEDLTVAQATALLNSMVGDSGAGGTKGLAPAPAAGDAALGKLLGAGGSFMLPIFLRTTKTAAYTLAATDQASLVSFTGAAATTFSITAAATLGSGWWCYVANKGTGAANAGQLTFDPNGAEQVDDGATIVTYPGDVRMITCDGTAFYTQVIAGGYVQYTTAGANTFTVPSNATFFNVEIWGGGGGAGGGGRNATSTTRSGGCGGGGGAYVTGRFTKAQVGASVTVTVAATANGGAAGAADTTDGANGTNGNNSTFGALLTAYGGGAGDRGGSPGGWGGGGGGGALSAASGSVGGGPLSATTGNSGMGGGYGTSNINGGASAWGGAAGGGGNGVTPASYPGGNSYRGGSGGGYGAYITAANVASAGKLGGGGQGALFGGSTSTVGAAGTTGVAGGTAGAATAGPSVLGPGTAGSGGGSGYDNTPGGTASAAGAGAAGGVACGGGGGGASQNGNAAGAGGAGGSGLCRITYG